MVYMYERPIKIEFVSPMITHSVSHPEQIDLEISWTDERDVKVDSLKFDIHKTKLKRVEWNVGGSNRSVEWGTRGSKRWYLMGYCEKCKVLFISAKPDTTPTEEDVNGWESFIFKHLFRKDEKFRKDILERAS